MLHKEYAKKMNDAIDNGGLIVSFRKYNNNKRTLFSLWRTEMKYKAQEYQLLQMNNIMGPSG